MSLNGLLNVDKWPGLTSHDVVQLVRRRLGIKKVGHTGTLDPSAGGVLLVLTGTATRTARFFNPLEKEYIARVVFGIETDTGDLDGTVIRTDSASGATAENLSRLFPEFTGEIEQIPPMVSAVKVNGTRLYKLAREGKHIKRQARKRVVHSIHLEEFDYGAEHPEALLRIVCGTGIYVRTLVSDMAAEMNTCAHLRTLIRTRIGSFTRESAVSRELLETGGSPTGLPAHILPMAKALDFLPKIVITQEQADSIRSGKIISCTEGGYMFKEGVRVREGEVVTTPPSPSYRSPSPGEPVLAVVEHIGEVAVEAIAVVTFMDTERVKSLRVFPESG